GIGELIPVEPLRILQYWRGIEDRRLLPRAGGETETHEAEIVQHVLERLLVLAHVRRRRVASPDRKRENLAGGIDAMAFEIVVIRLELSPRRWFLRVRLPRKHVGEHHQTRFIWQDVIPNPHAQRNLQRRLAATLEPNRPVI